MKPFSIKELTRYLKNKQHVFEPTSKILTNKKLNHLVTTVANQTNALHGRNLFLFNAYGQTLLTIDHLLITPKGLILIEETPALRDVEEIPPQWWQDQRKGVLYPNAAYQLDRVCDSLSEILYPIFNQEIPIFPYLIASKKFVPYIDTLDSLEDSILQAHQYREAVLGPKEIQAIQQTLLNLHEDTVKNKIPYYEPSFLQTQYNPFGFSKNKTQLYQIYSLLNNMLFDEVRSGRIYHRITLPTPQRQQATIQTLIFSEKGFLLMNFLDGGIRVEVDVEATEWKQFNDAAKVEEQHPLAIGNPIKLAELQGQLLLSSIGIPDIPLTYRVVGLTPIDLELSHPALTTDLNLEHVMDRYFKAYPDFLDSQLLYQVKSQLAKWATK